MKHKIRLHLLLIITALMFTLENPAWHWLDVIKAHPDAGTDIDMLVIWAETSLAIGAFAIIITLITPLFSKIFLGYESQKPEEGSEVYFYVVMTLFMFGLCLAGKQFIEQPRHGTEKDLKYICGLLNENLEFSRADGSQQKVTSICGEDPENPTSDKD